MNATPDTLKAALEHPANSLFEIIPDLYPEATITRGRTRAAWRGGDGQNVIVHEHRLHDFVKGETVSTWQFLTDLAGFSPAQAADYLKRRAGLASGTQESPQARRQAEAKVKHREAAARRLEAHKARTLEAAHELQRSAPEAGSSAYLMLKGVSSLWDTHRVAPVSLGGDETSPGVVFAENKRGSFIQLALRDLAGKVTGYQRIYDGKVLPGERDKDFIGSTGGAFVLLEPLDQEPLKRVISKSQKVYKRLPATGRALAELLERGYEVAVCEGFGTGASIALARPKAFVICALSAGNLMPILEVLRDRYGFTSRLASGMQKAIDFCIWADRDTSGTGQEKAHGAALRFEAYVRTPTFKGGGSGDFNDLHQARGLQAVRRTRRETPDARLAHAKTLAKQKLAPERHLAPLEVPEEGTALVIKAPQEAGKTHQLAGMLGGSGFRTLVVTHRESLARNLAMRLRFETYLDYAPNDLRHIKQLVITFDSLNKLAFSGDLRPYDVLVIDESEQVLEHTTGRHIKNKTANFAVLERLLTDTPRVICADADAGKLTRDVLRRYNPARRILWHEHEYHVAAGRTMHVLQDRDDTLDLYEKLTKPRWYATDSLRHSRNMQAHYQADPNTGSLVINSETATTDAAAAYLLDPTREAPNYERMIASPSVQTGLSDDSGHWQTVIGDFTGHASTPEDAMQALMRPRRVGEVYACVPRGRGEPLSVLEAMEGAGAADDLEGAALEREHHGARNPNYERLRAEVEARSTNRRTNYKKRFIEKAVALGYTVKIALPRDLSQAALDKRQERRTALKEAGLQLYVRDRVTAERIDANTAKTYEDAYNLSQDKRFALEQYQLRAFYRLPDDASASDLDRMLRADDYKTLRSKVERYESMLEPLHVARGRAEGELEAEVLRGDSRTHMLRHDYHQRLAAAVGFTLETETEVESWQAECRRVTAELQQVRARIPGAQTRTKSALIGEAKKFEADLAKLKGDRLEATYDARSESVRAFVTWCLEHYAALKAAGLVTCSRETLGSKPVEHINDSLKRCGLNSSSDKARSGRTYALTFVSISEMANYSRPRRENWQFAHENSIKNQLDVFVRKSSEMPSQTTTIRGASEVTGSGEESLSAADPSGPSTRASQEVETPPGLEALRALVQTRGPSPTRDSVLEAFGRADSGDDQALQALVAYMQRPDVQALVRPGGTA